MESKNLKKNIIRVLIILLVIGSMLPYFCFAFDEGDYTKPTVSTGDTTTIFNKAKPVIAIITFVGIIIAVVAIFIIGIKIMAGSVEEKAQYKQMLLPWLIGLAILVCITTIVSIIYQFASNV